jgi:hypothetical protein
MACSTIRVFSPGSPCIRAQVRARLRRSIQHTINLHFPFPACNLSLSTSQFVRGNGNTELYQHSVTSTNSDSLSQRVFFGNSCRSGATDAIYNHVTTPGLSSNFCVNLRRFIFFFEELLGSSITRSRRGINSRRLRLVYPNSYTRVLQTVHTRLTEKITK